MSDTQVHNGPLDGATPEPAAEEVSPLRMPLRLTPLGSGNGANSSHSWDEEHETKPKRRNKAARIAFLVGLGFVSFFIFVYLTFPYGVLKEVATTKINEALQASGQPISIRVGALHPYWFTGIELNNVVVSNATDANATLKLGEVTTRLNILPLFLGRIGVSGRATQAGGSLEFDAKIPIMSIIQGNPNPRTVEVSFKNFSLDALFNHGLAIPRASKDPAMMLIQPILMKTSAGGSLSGDIAFENIDKMTGVVDLTVANLFLNISDETLQIPQQNFSAAEIDLKYQNNALVFTDTKFEAPDIGIAVSGNITIPELPNAVSEANLDMTLNMHGQIEKSLGMIVPNIMRCKPLVDGKLEAKLQGPLTNMTCQ